MRKWAIVLGFLTLLAAARKPPLEFVEDLAEALVPAGIEIGAAHRLPGTRVPVDLAQHPRLSPGELAHAFNLHHSHSRAEVDDGVLVIRPAQNRTPYLDRAAPDAELHERSLMRLIDQVFSVLDPSLIAPGGRAASLLGPVGVEVDRGENVELTIDARGRTIISVLNELAKAAPGHAWLVVTDDETPPKITRVGLIHRYQTTTEHLLSTALQRP